MGHAIVVIPVFKADTAQGNLDPCLSCFLRSVDRGRLYHGKSKERGRGRGRGRGEEEGVGERERAWYLHETELADTATDVLLTIRAVCQDGEVRG